MRSWPPVFFSEQAKKIDLVEYLESLGYCPQKIRNNDYWYLSPLREEKEPSFKVNRKPNVFYDHGNGKGGNTIDFGILYHNCSLPEFLERLKTPLHQFSFHQQNNIRQTSMMLMKKEKITILDARLITSLSLQKYLQNRAIPVDLANQFCKEVIFELYGKKYAAIGFQNRCGGYELSLRRI